MRRIILHMIASNALAAFSVQPGAIGAARSITRARASSETPTTSATPATSLPRQTPTQLSPAGGGKILPRGSLLDLSV